MAASVTHLPVNPPQPAPSRWAAAVATATLDAGCGPRKVAWLVGDCEHADELFWDAVSAMASREGFASPEEYLTRTGCAAIWDASGPVS